MIKYKKSIFFFLIISSYLFGFLCIQLELWPQLVDFTWFQLLLCVAILVYHHAFDAIEYKKPFLIFMALSGLIGFFVEMIGVNTGLIFGEYSYGAVLGIRWLGTPLMIGVNWFLVSFTVNQMVSQRNLPFIIHALVAAIIITAIDVLIEPTAIATGMWTWETVAVPIQNYVGWFGLSLLISAIYKKLAPFVTEDYSKLILWCMVLFFGLKLIF